MRTLSLLLCLFLVPACASAPARGEQAQKTPTYNLTLVIHNGHDTSSFTVTVGDGGSKIGDASGDVAGTASSAQTPTATQTTTANPNVNANLPGSAGTATSRPRRRRLPPRTRDGRFRRRRRK